MTENRLLKNAQEIADYLKLDNPQQAREWCKRGIIKSITTGGPHRKNYKAYTSWLDDFMNGEKEKK